MRDLLRLADINQRVGKQSGTVKTTEARFPIRPA